MAQAAEKEKEDLLNELQILVTIGEHPNIISLIGACTKSGNYSREKFVTVVTAVKWNLL